MIAQIHVAFLRAHNRLIDQGYKFEQARQLMKWRHQWIVVHEFLPEVLDPGVYADVFRSDRKIQTKYYDPNNAQKADTPVEFSVAAYRFGHSQVRRAYNMTQGGPRVQVFNNTAGDLHGGRQIATDHIIFWPNFLIVDGQAGTGQPNTTQPVANISRKIDTVLSSGLFALPIPGAAPEGSAILAKRNIQRARGTGFRAAKRSQSVWDSPRWLTLILPRIITFRDCGPLSQNQLIKTSCRCGSTCWRSRRSSTMVRSWARSAAALWLR